MYYLELGINFMKPKKEIVLGKDSQPSDTMSVIEPYKF